MLLPGEVTVTAWLPTCDAISDGQWSYPVSALSGGDDVTAVGSHAVAVTSPAKSMAAVA